MKPSGSTQEQELEFKVFLNPEQRFTVPVCVLHLFWMWRQTSWFAPFLLKWILLKVHLCIPTWALEGSKMSHHAPTGEEGSTFTWFRENSWDVTFFQVDCKQYCLKQWKVQWPHWCENSKEKRNWLHKCQVSFLVLCFPLQTCLCLSVRITCWPTSLESAGVEDVCLVSRIHKLHLWPMIKR